MLWRKAARVFRSSSIRRFLRGQGLLKWAEAAGKRVRQMWMYEKRPGKANHSRFAGVIWRRRALILSTFLDARLRGHDEKVGAWREGVGMARRCGHDEKVWAWREGVGMARRGRDDAEASACREGGGVAGRGGNGGKVRVWREGVGMTRRCGHDEKVWA